MLGQGWCATDSKRLLRSLTGYSKHHYKTFSWVEEGHLCGKVKDNPNIDKILTLVRLYIIANKWSEDDESGNSHLYSVTVECGVAHIPHGPQVICNSCIFCNKSSLCLTELMASYYIWRGDVLL